MDLLQQITRRHFFRNCAVGVGSIALASLLSESLNGGTQQPLAASRTSDYPPRAKNVIYLFMAGGPSQLELLADQLEEALATIPGGDSS